MTLAVPVPGAIRPDAAALAEAMRRRRRRRELQRLLFGIGVPAALLALWEALVWLGAVDRRFFPPPSRIAEVAVAALSDPAELATLSTDLGATLRRLVIGYTLGSVGGIAAGMLMALYPPLRFGFAPIVYATFPTPKLAIFPLLIVIFGLGDPSKTALVTLGVFYMTCINTLSGVLYANPIYRDVAQAFRLPVWTRWMHVVLPSSLPAIVAGLKLGLGQALILVVSSEFVAADTGIGTYIWNAWQVLDISRMFVGLLVVGIVGGLAVLAGSLLERRLIPWATH